MTWMQRLKRVFAFEFETRHPLRRWSCTSANAVLHESMKSLTVRLPDDIAERLERESRERGISKSDLVRERLSQDSPRQPSGHELMAILEESWADSAGDETGNSGRRTNVG